MKKLVVRGGIVVGVEGQDAPLPSLPRLARNFAAATARDVAHGGERLDKAATGARLAICRACPDDLYFIDAKGRERCKHKACGCYLASKAKRPHERCPKFHW